MTQSNSRGSSKESGTLSTFDRLARSVRVALRDANRDYNVVSLFEKFRSGAISAKALIKYIQQRDVEVTKQQSAELWGTDYPVDLIKSDS